MQFQKEQICCFSGYRPEKMDIGRWADAQREGLLERAVRRAASSGCVVFMTGMSRGFDLWGAQMVLALRAELGLKLWCVIPFAAQAEQWGDEWRELYQDVLLHSDRTFCLAEDYSPDCFYHRNRFLVQGASRMICWYDGQTGGTAYTVRLARKEGLWIDNLADPQTSFWDGL